MSFALRVAVAFLRLAATGYAEPTEEQVAEWKAGLLRAGVDPEVADRKVSNARYEARYLAGLSREVADSATRLAEDLKDITERSRSGRE